MSEEGNARACRVMSVPTGPCHKLMQMARGWGVHLARWRCKMQSLRRGPGG